MFLIFRIRIWKWIMPLWFLLLLLLHACVGDEHKISTNCGNCKGVNMLISFQGSPEVSTFGTKSETGSQRRNFNEIIDLNVILFPANANAPDIYYFDRGSQLPDGLPLPLHPGVNASFTLITASDYTSAEIYLVGNYGAEINSNLISAVQDLENLSLPLPADNIPEKCIMFAKAVATGEEDGSGCRLMKAELRRTLAMVTVSLDGTMLREGVHIKPTKISLHNVPSMFRLGAEENKADGQTLREGYSYVDTWGVLDKTTGTIGADAHTDIDKFAFFLFENRQGTTSNTDEKNKISDGGTMPYATYLTVEAQYSYDDNFKGDVTYKFCLGANTTNDYNVRRNTHYIVTLSLNDWGGAEEGGRLSGGVLEEGQGEGVNWRVIMNLWDFNLPETDYRLGANAGEGWVLLDDGNSKFVDYQFFPDTDDEWVLVSAGGRNDPWVSIRNGIGSSNLLNSGYFWYFFKPWRYNDAGFPKSDIDQQYRECHITIRSNSNNVEQTLVFRQWAPVKITDDFYVERFPDDPDLETVWRYQNVVSLPVGFTYWDAYGADASYGYENTSILVDSPPATRCRQHGGRDLSLLVGDVSTLVFDYAAYYLPPTAELALLMNYEKDIFNPAHTYFEPLDRSRDYWSSSATNTKATYYWDAATSGFMYTTNRNGLKYVRCVYRPSKDP